MEKLYEQVKVIEERHESATRRVAPLEQKIAAARKVLIETPNAIEAATLGIDVLDARLPRDEG